MSTLSIMSSLSSGHLYFTQSIHPCDTILTRVFIVLWAEIKTELVNNFTNINKTITTILNSLNTKQSTTTYDVENPGPGTTSHNNLTMLNRLMGSQPSRSYVISHWVLLTFICHESLSITNVYMSWITEYY